MILSRSAVITALVLGAATATAATVEAQTTDAGKGRRIFVEKGCWACHGYSGQGGVAGPRIAPEPMPLEALIPFLRNASSTRMPPYDARSLPDTEVRQIHAWLASLPQPADWRTIPLLQSTMPETQK